MTIKVQKMYMILVLLVGLATSATNTMTHAMESASRAGSEHPVLASVFLGGLVSMAWSGWQIWRGLREVDSLKTSLQFHEDWPQDSLWSVVLRSRSSLVNDSRKAEELYDEFERQRSTGRTHSERDTGKELSKGVLVKKNKKKNLVKIYDIMGFPYSIISAALGAAAVVGSTVFYVRNSR